MDFSAGPRIKSSASSDDSSRIVVFLGPTLPVEDAQTRLDAIYVKPASQGHVLLAAHAFHPRLMILIDGQFEDRPAVRHKEILWAMSRGITVVGAASMGALRAVELAPFGMIGIGAIYRWYRRWALAPDDAVAVQSGPAEIGFPPLTDAMIDLQATFTGLRRRGLITVDEQQRLTRLARDTNFRERAFATILAAGGWTPAEIDRLARERVQLKRRDAMAALDAAPRLAASRPPSRHRACVVTNTFLRDLDAAGIDPALIDSYSP